MNPQILLDSADPNVWEELLPLGLFKGITTNPTLIRKTGNTCSQRYIKKLTQKAEDLGCQEIHLQAWGKSSEEIASCGELLNSLATKSLKIHIKIPITKEGCIAAKRLIEKNTSITFTACYEVHQVLVASAIGASYIAPYMGRINDNGKNGLEEVIRMQKAIDGIKTNCRLLVASIRNKESLSRLSAEGISTFTINHALAIDMLNIPTTIHAAKQFEEDVNG